MDKRPSELMLLCSRSAAQLRNLRADQVEVEDEAKMQDHLQWLEKSKIMGGCNDDEKQKDLGELGKKVPRPMNSFMVFSHLERKRLAEENPELHNADLSKILGRKWKTLSPGQRQPYIDEAERLRVLHTETYPEYKYKPRKRKHPKRNTKKFSTLSANDVTMKTKIALNLDCSLPPVANHPLSVNADGQKSLTPSSSPISVSPASTQGNFDVFFDNSAIPPTPNDSPLMSPDLQDVESKMKEKQSTNFYNFLPPTPELSPMVTTSVTRGAFNFEGIPNGEIKSENIYTCILPRSVSSINQPDGGTGANREDPTGNTGLVLPLMTPFVPVYPSPEETQVIAPASREEGPLFGDVDRDEFDQYLGTSLEKSPLSNSLRNIIAELEDNLKK